MLFRIGTVGCFLVSTLAYGQAPQRIKIPAGQTADLWYGVNVTGNLNIRIQTRDGKNELKLSWIKWGVGSIQEIGNWGPAGSINIPIAWWRGIVSAKLRGEASNDTIVYISDRVAIDKKFVFDW